MRTPRADSQGGTCMARKLQNILETIGNTPIVQDQPAGAGWREPLRQDRGVQSARLGQGPPGACGDRSRREIRRAEARPDRRRGDQRQHRHRPRHGLRGEGLPVRADHGRALQRRAPQADALPRRQGGHHPGRRARGRHDQEDPGTGRRRMAGSGRASSRTRPTPTTTPGPRPARSSTPSKAIGSTIG